MKPLTYTTWLERSDIVILSIHQTSFTSQNITCIQRPPVYKDRPVQSQWELCNPFFTVTLNLYSYRCQQSTWHPVMSFVEEQI